MTEKAADADGIVWLAINAKYSHTSLSVRYLREAVPGSRILEVTTAISGTSSA